MCLALVGGVVTGGALTGSEAMATKEVEVECGIAPSKGEQVEPATNAVFTSAASGDAKVEDRVVTADSVAASEVTAMKEAKVE